MTKKNEEKFAKGIAPTLKAMKVKEVVYFPLSKIQSVKSTASIIKLLDRKKFVTKQMVEQSQVKVTRIF